MQIVRLLLIPVLAVGVYYFSSSGLSWSNPTILMFESLILISLVVLAAELSAQAARLFHEEIKWKTYPNLTLVPLSQREIALGKIRGCLWGCAPVFLWLMIGIVWRTITLWDQPLSAANLVWIISCFAQFVLFLLVVLYFSLIVRWGALPLAAVAFAAYLMFDFSCLSIMLIGPLMANSQFGSIALASYSTIVSLIVSALLLMSICDRLNLAKGE